MTEDEVESLKGEEGDLRGRIVSVQCTKPPDVVTRTADALNRFQLNKEARKLRGW